MVVFTCQHCGSSLNKNKVEKHYVVECRNSPHVTCVDCLKDFRGNEYVAHTQCMTEEQRYAAKGFVAKTPPSVKKRATWLNSVEAALNTSGLTKAQQNLIQSLLKHSNIPQKKKKFLNFVKSAFGRQFAIELVDSVFDVLEETHKKNVANEKTENISASIDSNSKHQLNNNEKSNVVHKNEEELNSSVGEIERNNELNGETEKMKKKKNKKLSISESENHDNDNSTTVESQDLTINGSNNSNVGIVKKKKKNRSITESENHESFDNDNSTAVESQDVTVNGSNNSNVDIVKSEQKLSKKELKAIKKRAKYEAQLNEIENNQNIDEGVINEENVKEMKKKKNKKNKLKDNEENVLVSEVNGVQNKKNKRCIEENNTDEPLTKKSKMFDSETLNKSIEPNEGGGTFNWNEIIVKVLESQSDKELSVKRLCKKIINEYQAVFGENHMTYEKLLSKFNKKLHKTPNVRVLKDKVKLMT